MSDLLNSASLVMIPSGYKEDTVFSAIPTDGSGDLSFTRASNGTRVNSAGLVEVCPWNLATYSEQFTNAIYTPKNGTFTDNFAVAPNGTTTAAKWEATDSDPYIYQAFTGANVDYTATCWIKATGTAIGKNCSIRISGTVAYSVLTGDWQRLTITGNINGSTNIGVEAPESATSGEIVYIWGFQINLGSTAKPYFPTTDRLNVPRLTYQNGGGGCPSLLLEKQSTNLAWPSENLTGWTSGGMTNSTNQTISPDGTQNGGKSTIGSTTRYYDVTTNGITTVNGTTYTTSFFAKKGTGIESIYFYQGDGGRIAKWNLNNGAYIGYAPADGYTAFTSYGSESLGNGWYRFYATYTASSTSGNLTIGVSTNTNNSITQISGNGTDFVYVWGLQYEASSYPTSYIPTTSASATRVADACSKTGISSLIGQTEGVLFADVIFLNPEPMFFLSIVGTDWLTDSIYFELSNTTNYIAVSSVKSSTGVGSATSTIAPTANSRYKIAVQYSGTAFNLYINGTKISGTRSANALCSKLYLNELGTLSSTKNNLQTKFNEVVTFTTALSDAECISLTTI